LAGQRRRQFQQHAGRERRDHAQRDDRRIAGLQHRQQCDRRFGVPGHGRIGLAVRRRRPGARPRHVRSGVAQRNFRRVPGLQHRQQSNHGIRQPGSGRTGLAAWRSHGQSAGRRHRRRGLKRATRASEWPVSTAPRPACRVPSRLRTTRYSSRC
jgi:hypothetical protein